MHYGLRSDGAFIEMADEEAMFLLLQEWFRGKVPTRFGPQSQFFDLYVRFAAGARTEHFLLKDDPRTADSVNAIAAGDDPLMTVEHQPLDPFDVNGTVPLAHGPNNVPVQAVLLTRGTVIVREDEPQRKNFEFQSDQWQGCYTLTQQPGSDLWTMEKYDAAPLSQSYRDVLVFKTDQAEQIVWGIVLEPDEVDSQGHFITEQEIAEALHYFMLNWQLMDEEHQRVVPRSQASPVEAFQAPTDLEWPVNDKTVSIKKGSWVMATKIFDSSLWKKYLQGELNAYSIRGWGKIRDVKEAA